MNQWITAGFAMAGGIVAGVIAGWTARRVLLRRGAEDIAGPTATFLFWFFSFVGMATGIAVLTPATLETIPRQLLGFLPRILAAGLILLGAWGVSSLVSRLVKRGLVSASGQRNLGLETTVRVAIVAIGFVFAVAQLGIDTTILAILAAVVAGSLGLAFALLVGLGGRSIAAEVAAGRYLGRHLEPGDRIRHDDEELEVEELHPASIEAVCPDGTRRVIPYHRLLEEGFSIME